MSTTLYDFNPNTLAGSSGTAVSSLVDSVGGVVTLSQATGGAQPTISTTAFPGFKSLHSAGTQWMRTGTFSALPTGSVIWMVFQYTTLSNPATSATNQEALAYNEVGGAVLVDNTCFFGFGAGSNPYGYRISPGTNNIIMAVVINGSSSQLWVNGAFVYQGSLTTLSTVTELAFFTDNTGATVIYGCQGDLARLRVYSAMTTTELKAQMVADGSTYGITTTTDDLRFTTSTGTLPTSGVAYTINQSVNYNSGTPTVVGLFVPGTSGNNNEIIQQTGNGVFQDAFFKRNGLVAAIDMSWTTGFNQTNLNSAITAIKELITHLQASFNVKDIILMGQSRGGVPAQAVLSQTSASVTPGFIGFYPCCDGVTWWSTTDPTTNPLTITASNFNGKWMQFNAATTDTLVSKSANSDAMYAHVAGNVAERVDVTTQGLHGDTSNIGYNRINAFIDRCTGVVPEYTVTPPGSTAGPVGTPSGAYTLQIANATVSDQGTTGSPVNSSLSFDAQYSLTLTGSATEQITATDSAGTISGNGTNVVTVTPGNTETSFTFTRKPTTAGLKTTNVTNPATQAWANPSPLTFTAAAAGAGGTSLDLALDLAL